jgi:uncharacterized membrane protein
VKVQTGSHHDDGKATAAGILLGAGLGGLMDGIVLHQLLQWHNVISHVTPPDTVDALRTNILWDGLFFVLTMALILAGLLLFWQAARNTGGLPPAVPIIGLLVLGLGLFNIIEGLLNHFTLGIHHVRESVDPLLWDVGFLVVAGILPTVIGWLLVRQQRQRP